MADNQRDDAGHQPPQPAAKLRMRRMPTPLSTIRVTEQGLDDFLQEGPSAFPPGPDTYLTPADCVTPRRHGHDNDGQDEIDFDEDAALSSNGDHVGRDLSNKQQPVHPLDDSGPNPHGDRLFYGDEFQGMLTFDAKGVPTFHSRFPEAKSVQDITELRVNIATKLPAYMTGDTPQAEEMEAMENDAFDGNSLEDVFARVDDKMVAQVERYAKEFEQAFGIKMTVGFDLPDPHLSLMGYTKGDPNLLGFASFPPGINDWPELEGLGVHAGYMVMNNQYTETASEKEVYDLFSHEFGHTLGLAHPHDLALLNMSKREALTATKMAYTDLKLRAFQHLVTDGEGNPVLDDKGEKQYSSFGPDEGVLDLGFRKWVANPGKLDHAKQPDPNKPGYDGYNAVFDLEAHSEFAKKENARSIVFLRERLLPMVPMVAEGKNTVLKGTPGDDFLDTNPGYASLVKVGGTRVKQKFVLTEGHMEKVLGISGNNTIIAAQNGKQEIHPGTGENEIRMLYADMKGEKTIVSEGKDTLVLTDELLEAQSFKARKSNGAMTLTSDKGARITLAGEGVQKIRVVNHLGRVQAEIDVQGLSSTDLNREFLEGNAWKKQAEQRAKKADPDLIDPLPQTFDRTPPLKLGGGARTAEQGGSWLDRVQQQDASKGAGRLF